MNHFENSSHTRQCGESTNVSLFSMDDSVMCMGDEMPDDEIAAKSHHQNVNANTGVSLRQQVMLNQFGAITGCSHEQSLQLLLTSNWQYQTALSLFFDDFAMPTQKIAPTKTNNPLANSNLSCLNSLSFCAPSNTPVTPPNLDYLEKAFSKLNSASNTSSTTTQATIASNGHGQLKTNVVNNSNSQIFSTNISTSNANSNSCSSTSGNKLQTFNKTTFLPSASGSPNLRSQKSMPLPIASSSLFCFNNNTN